MKITIFYSWQTSTDTKYNKYFIFSCLEKAIKNLKREPDFQGVDFILLEGLRGESGSPGVASTITDKRIPDSDIFLADLTVGNQISRFSKFVMKYFDKKKFRPAQNNNVINEHGFASITLGKDKIIGVLNSAYGSPNENPENITFDLRHLRFPIEYNYSKKTKDKDKIQKPFINDLTNSLRVTSIHVLQHQKDKNYPFQNWESWEKSSPMRQKFFINGKIENINEIIASWVHKPKDSIRLLGLSGLGKTRILMEFFKAKESDNQSFVLRNKVLYLNCNLSHSIDFRAEFNKLGKEDENRIIILDNCSRKLLREVLSFINFEENKISLITIDSNPEEIEQDKVRGVNYLIIKKEDLSSVVSDILLEDFSMLDKESIEKIKEFSQGIPLMAVLIGESLKEGERYIGKMEDKELLNKLLGPNGQDERNRKILKSCSIFNYFGIEDELKSQLEFIATNKNITSLDGDDKVIIDDFYGICNYYLKREIFERRGRMIGMRPFPLAMSLAQEWLEQCTPDKLINVIESLSKLKEPDRKQLSDSLSEQMKHLGYNEKAVTIFEKIVGPGSPFDNAEVLNTELGSRLFRSFVEVNPVAVASNFTRNFLTKSKSELEDIREGRRNLVWVLEKLCFDKRTFLDSAKVMYSFAVAENETWSNNATGQFLQLFKIILPGTEASLEDRWKIIEWGLGQSQNEYHILAIRAMGVGLSYGHFSRMGGAESQGSSRLYDYQPSSSEVEIYWKNILRVLTSVIQSKNALSSSAGEIIANSIRSVFNARLARLIMPFIKEVAECKQYDWDEGLKGLRMARNYEKGFISKDLLTQIDALIVSLTKKDFGSRYLNIESSYYLDHDEPYSSEKVKEAVKALADEFILQKLKWELYFPLFYQNRVNFSFYFGKRLYELISDNPERTEEFIDKSLNIISSVSKHERDLTVLGGFFSIASAIDKDKLYKRLESINELNYLSFYFVSLNNDGKSHFDLLFRLIDEKGCDLQEFQVFRYSNALSKLGLVELGEFAERLFSYGNEGYAIVFDLFYNLGYDNKELNDSLLPIFKKCILKLGISKTERQQLDEYKWVQVICLILKDTKETDFAAFINKTIIDSISYQNSYNLDHNVKQVYELLLKLHFDAIWPYLSDTLLAEGEEYIKFYGLKNILGAHIGGYLRSSGVLFVGNLEEIFKWCEIKKPKAPARLAELVPIFGDDNSDYSSWNSLTMRLIEEFGEIEEVLQAIEINMGNYAWTGSVVPLLRSKYNLFKNLTNHKFATVSDWAMKNMQYLEIRIKQEKNMDEEMYL